MSELLADLPGFLAVLVGLVGLPGVALVVALHPLCRDGLERLFVALVGGFVAACVFAIWVAPIHPWLVALLPVAALAWLGWRRATLSELIRRGFPQGRLYVLIALALVVVSVAPSLDWLEPVDDGFVLTTYYDQFLHTAVIGELVRGVPAEQTPYVAGEPFWRYHPFTNLFGLFFVRLGGVDALTTHLVLQPAFAWLVVGLGLIVVVRLWAGSTAAGILATAAFFCPVYAQKEALGMLGNPASLMAMLPLLGAVWAVSRDVLAPSRRAFVFAAVCAAAVFPTKANIFMAVLPAFAVYALAAAVRRRFVDVLLGAAAGAVVVAVPFVMHVTHPMPRDVGFAYGSFATFLAGRFGTSFDPATVFGPIGIVAQWYGRLGGLWWLAAGLALFHLLRHPRRGPALIATAGLLVSTVLVCLFPTEAGARHYEAWNAAWFIRFPIILLLVAAGTAGLVRTIPARLGRAPAAARWALPLALALQVASASVALARGNPAEPILLSRGWVDAMAYIRRATPRDAVVLAEQNLWGGTYTSGFSLRRAYVERVVMMAAYYDSVPSRLADVDLVWGSPDPESSRAVLEAGGIDLLMERTDRPIPAATRAGLTLRFEEGQDRVWSFARGGAPARGLTDEQRRLHDEAERRYRAVIEVMQGRSRADVAAQQRVSPDRLQQWIDRALARRSVLDVPWPAASTAGSDQNRSS